MEIIVPHKPNYRFCQSCQMVVKQPHKMLKTDNGEYCPKCAIPIIYKSLDENRKNFINRNTQLNSILSQITGGPGNERYTITNENNSITNGGA